MSTPLRTRPRLCADVAPTAVVPTGFTHHGGHEFGDDGASLPHLALLAVREVGEDARDAPGTRGLAGVDHDQHLHDGGVDVPDEKSRRRRREGGFKTRSEAELKSFVFIFFSLGHSLDHKDIFASHRLLDLHPCLYGNGQSVSETAAGERTAIDTQYIQRYVLTHFRHGLTSVSFLVHLHFTKLHP